MAEETRGFKDREGGWGWMIVAGCFLTNICTRAVTRCVSIFFVEFQQHFGRDYSSTAWIHSTIDGITMLCAPLGGFLGNHFSCRSIVMVGGLLSFTGMVLSSFATSLPYLYVTMGLVTGLGFALSYTPSVAMVGNYFHERKALAYGIGLSGSGIGTFILAPAVQLLIELYSWRGALLVLGGFVANLCVCGALLRPIKPKSKADDRLWENKMAAQKDYVTPRIDSENTELMSSDLTKEDLAQLELNNSNNSKTIETENKTMESMNQKNKEGQSFLASDANLTCIVSSKLCGLCLCLESKDEFSFLFHPDFLILLVSVLFMATGCSSPLVYLVPYALSLGMEHQNAAFLMSIFGISSIMGNITFGWITDRPFLKQYRLLNYMGAILMEGLCCVFLPFLISFPALAVCVVVYGYFDGAYVALIPVVVSDVVGPSNLTPALGVVYFLHAIPYLVSPPIGGLLVDITGAYTSTFHLCGASYMISAGILTAAIVTKRWRRSKSTSVV
ncbi:monocarboxylate transporter 12-like [Eucyclogobius newberryi]|uniref:monocarboxylate transporter 12-like n=1 Tax=Eucyclogobius newberryi TaxID=166745 RepID=UPI003B590B61